MAPENHTGKRDSEGGIAFVTHAAEGENPTFKVKYVISQLFSPNVKAALALVRVMGGLVPIQAGQVDDLPASFGAGGASAASVELSKKMSVSN